MNRPVSRSIPAVQTVSLYLVLGLGYVFTVTRTRLRTESMAEVFHGEGIVRCTGDEFCDDASVTGRRVLFEADQTNAALHCEGRQLQQLVMTIIQQFAELRSEVAERERPVFQRMSKVARIPERAHVTVFDAINSKAL